MRFFFPNGYGARGGALHLSIRIKLDESSYSKLGVNVGLVHLRFLKWLWRNCQKFHLQINSLFRLE